MFHRLAHCLPVALPLAFALAACGSAAESDGGSGGTGGAGTPSSTSSTTSTSAEGGSDLGEGGGDLGEGGSGGAAPCVGLECLEQQCDACETSGRVCEMPCAGEPTINCFDAPTPGDGELVCGNDEVCAADEACVHYNEGIADACGATRCEPLPEGCSEEPTCECLAQYLEEADNLSCYDEDGVRVGVSDNASDDGPWDDATCSGVPCDAGESCWACTPGGSPAGTPPSYECAVQDPSPVPGHCYSVWSIEG